MDTLIEQHRQQIVSIATANGATNVRLFGSRARGEARTDSDVDLLICLDNRHTLLHLIAIKQDIEDVLGCNVDVLTEKCLEKEMRDEVLREAVTL